MKISLFAAALLSLVLSACVTTERTEKETVVKPAPSSSTVVVPSDRPSDSTTVIVPR